ncbi:MAG: peptidylprolyl isomerase [Polynucleobacter sp.]|jgi:hypothetical protein|nr:peptidylprolyl isomerase [Polynucleobacter sp.]
MFDLIRKHQKLIQIFLMLLIIPSFVFFGISSYTGFFDQETDLVKVSGRAITLQELDNAAKRQAERFGGNSQIAQSLPFRQAVLDELIQQRLLAFGVNELNLKVSEETLAKNIAAIPEIKALYKPDGSFDGVRYRQLLANIGLTVEQFENSQRFDLLIQQLVTSIARTEIATKRFSGMISQLYDTERQVQSLTFKATDFLNKVSVTDSQLQDFYQANGKLFEVPATIDVEYLVLKADPKEDAKAFNAKADQFANLTYDQADSLKPAADKLKLNIQSAKGVSRAGGVGLGRGHPLTHPKVLQALFGEDTIKNKRNIEAVQIEPGTYVSARVIAYVPARTLPFAEVSAEVKRQVSIREAAKLATNAAKERLAVLQKDPKEVVGFSKANWVSRNRPLDLQGPAIDAVMALDAQKLPALVSVNSSSQDVTIYRVDQVRQPTTVDSKIRDAQAQQIQALAAQAEFAAFMTNLRSAAKVKLINPLKASNASAGT